MEELEKNIPERLHGRLSSFIVPCFNEEDALPIFYRELLRVIEEMGGIKFELILIDDGSQDGTLETIKELAASDSRVRYLSFSRNFGKEAAIYAGLERSKGEFVAIMDADLQDPPSLLPQMYGALLCEGYDCAAASRSDRKGEGRFRSFVSNLFYKVVNKVSDVKLVAGARDFRLMRRCVVDAILSLPENNRFTKGIYEWVGFKTKHMSFENVHRCAGKTKWSLRQLFFYALDGILAFSTLPLALASLIGLIFCLLSSVAILFVAVRQLVYWNSAPGWASLVCIILFLSGLQLLCLGVIGQYLAKSYLETKRRPIYIIREDSDAGGIKEL
ncbi:MAG: glycosyltransferase family 2 protein [Opitutales bacterium]|nr:glycosyltransferase family 2 protein [Opitutales bacterium]